MRKRFLALIALAIVLTASPYDSRADEDARRKALMNALQGADRLTIEPVQFGRAKPAEKEKKPPFEINGAAKVKELLGSLHFDESAPAFHCMCAGDHELRFYRGKELLATVRHHHGISLRWLEGKWEGDSIMTDATQIALPQWFKTNGFPALQAAREAQLVEAEQRANAIERFVAPFPEKARPLFTQPFSSLPGDNSENIDERLGREIIEIVSDENTIAVAVCRAFGTLENHNADWTSTTEKERRAIIAMKIVSGEQFLNTLERLKDNHRGLLGAARFFFREDYLSKIPNEARAIWAARLLKVTLTDGSDDNKSYALRRMTEVDDPAIRVLLREVMRGKIGSEFEFKPTWNAEPGIRAGAAISLATLDDKSSEKEIRELLTVLKQPQQIAALEVSLALLGDPTYIKAEHFKFGSYSIGMGGITAIKRQNGAYGLDVLVHAGLRHPWGKVNQEAENACERITGRKFGRVNRRQAIETWWEKEGAGFVKKRREKLLKGEPNAAGS